MDAAEPSTNGVSASNLFRLSSLLDDAKYEALARSTVGAFEAEIMQYPWLFGSFMPGVVAAATGVRGVVRVGGVARPGAAAGGGDAAGVAAESVAVPEVVLRAPGGETSIPTATAAATSAVESVGEAATASGSASAKEVFHPVAMDTTESGGIVEAGETPHPASKRETRTPNPKTKPRGRLETTCYVDESHGLWVRERNKLVGELKPRDDGKERVMVCEGMTCREVDEVEGW